MDIKSNKTNGSLKISEDVVAKIARLAACEVEGVALDENGKRLAREEETGLHALTSQFSRPVIKVRLSKEAAEIDIAVVALQGFKAANIGERVQQAVKSAVQNMAGIAVSKVNVKIAGIRLTEHA
ncbi:MAG: Asp23/Gls24 family envelope stress response protein [Oscillospiraceae bacterium]|nr:Asp23/Gls24 family envelope stress response protein [Oscillospiraceae bacterium]